jgi:tRNA pseudouridine38-40 synthase
VVADQHASEKLILLFTVISHGIERLINMAYKRPEKNKSLQLSAHGNDRYRYRLLLEYDGTNFSGWQKQREARTVQGDLLKTLQRLYGGKVIDLQGCGRTDAGVHALGYVAHLEMNSRLSLKDCLDILNDNLPKDISVLAINPVELRFHARHSCIARSYCYEILIRKSAFGKRYSWWVRAGLDLERMRQAAETMAGMHDFAAFAEQPELKKSTKVLVYGVQLELEGTRLVIRVTASHFLWRMVRRMVGVLVAVGAGRLSVMDIATLFSAAPASLAEYTAPAAGLFFDRAHYADEELQSYLQKCKT